MRCHPLSPLPETNMPSRLELIGFGFTILCLILAAYSGMRAVITNSKFLSYLKQNHYQQWNDFLGEDMPDLIRHIYFTPLNSEKSYYYFIFKSREDFGDKQVSEYKKQIRYGLYGFILYAIAGVSSFGITGFVLSQLSR
jgi:hypothetical protein